MQQHGQWTMIAFEREMPWTFSANKHMDGRMDFCILCVPRDRYFTRPILPSINPLTGTRKSQRNGPQQPQYEYDDWLLAVDGWAVTFGSVRRGLGGPWPRPVPSSLYKM